MKYKGKTAVWFYAMALCMNLMIPFLCLQSQEQLSGGETGRIIGVIALLASDLLILPMIVRNYVILEEEELLIRVGFFTQRVRYGEIESIKKTHNPLSSMALSLDRIEIKWRNGDVMVSVQEREAFIEELNRRADKAGTGRESRSRTKSGSRTESGSRDRM